MHYAVYYVHTITVPGYIYLCCIIYILCSCLYSLGPTCFPDSQQLPPSQLLMNLGVWMISYLRPNKKHIRSRWLLPLLPGWESRSTYPWRGIWLPQSCQGDEVIELLKYWWANSHATNCDQLGAEDERELADKCHRTFSPGWTFRCSRILQCCLSKQCRTWSSRCTADGTAVSLWLFVKRWSACWPSSCICSHYSLPRFSFSLWLP